MASAKYRFSPSLLAKWSDYVDCEALYEEIYGNSEEPALTLEEFEAKQEAELWDAINRVPQPPSEAAARGTLLNAIVDCKVSWQRPDAKYNIRRVSDESGRMVAIAGECDGFQFEFDAGLCRMLFDYFKGCTCQYRCEAEIDTCFGPVILYGDADYIRRDVVYDLKTTKSYKYGKYGRGWQKDVYPYCLIESGDLDTVSGFEYTVVELSLLKNKPISGTLYREWIDYSHDGAKVRLRAVSEALAAYLEMNAERIVHPSRVLNEI